MGDVVDLSARRSQPTYSGNARCLACGYTWVAVVPAGVDSFECPGCRCGKGVFIGFCPPPGKTPVWTCHSCGCQLFFAQPEALVCSLCGWEHHFCDEQGPYGPPPPEV